VKKVAGFLKDFAAFFSRRQSGAFPGVEQLILSEVQSELYCPNTLRLTAGSDRNEPRRRGDAEIGLSTCSPRLRVSAVKKAGSVLTGG
jgi:hypothetical protein